MRVNIFRFTCWLIHNPLLQFSNFSLLVLVVIGYSDIEFPYAVIDISSFAFADTGQSKGILMF
jgi:hypothetical protein